MSVSSLLEPGAGRAAGLADDEAVLRAMLAVESAWARVLQRLGVLDAATADAVVGACATGVDLDVVAAGTEASGNPVVPLVAALRAGLEPDAARAVHRGLTSQDVLDTALMLLTAAAMDHTVASLDAAVTATAQLADAHRGTLRVARTLGQWALPTTFGLTAAGWLVALDDVRRELRAVRASLPVQLGGAAGTLAAVEALAPGRALEAGSLLAGELGLVWPGRPWHTHRAPVTRVADALVRTADALGTVAADVVLLSRPELAEVSEPSAPGRGGSSTLAQKRNPVLSVLVRATALEAPHPAAQLHSAAAQAVDQRPDGAWHAEWPATARLLRRVPTAAAQLAEVLTGLQVHPEAMRRHVDDAGPALLSERLLAAVGPDHRDALTELLRERPSVAQVRDALAAALPGGTAAELDALLDPSGYLGAANALVDDALARTRGGAA